MVFLRFSGALVGFFLGFFLAAQLLQVSQVTPVSSQVQVVFLLAVAFAILGWLGAPYATTRPFAWISRRIHDTAAGDLAAGILGGGVGLVLALFLALPLSFLPGEVGRYAPLVGAAALSLLGVTAGTIKRADLQEVVRGIRGGRSDRDGDRLLLDTSVIIDGRIADIVRAGFIRGRMIVPRFILAELQYFADSGDGTRRERGRRGLEMLAKMQKESTVTVEIDDEDPAGDGADGKLLELARARRVPIVTNDYGLNRVAELHGVTVLNVNDLAKAVRPVVLPGEEIHVRVIQEGKEAGQGVGYLEDGTMIVVENGARAVGNEIPVTVMRVLQTVGGRMIFVQPRGEVVDARRPRAVGH